MTHTYRVWPKVWNNRKDEVALSTIAVSPMHAAVRWAEEELVMGDESSTVLLVEAPDGTVTEWKVVDMTEPHFVATRIVDVQEQPSEFEQQRLVKIAKAKEIQKEKS